MKNFGEKEAWAYPRTAHFLGTPYYLRNGKSCGFQIWPVHSEGPSEQKPIKNFGEKGAWAYPVTAQFFFGYTQLSHEWLKLRTSNNFACTFTGSIGTKAHYNFGKSSCGRSQGLPKVLRVPTYIRRIAWSSLR